MGARSWSAPSAVSDAGLYVYDLTDPGRPAFRDSVLVTQGLHTATIADHRRWQVTSSRPGTRAIPPLMIYDITDPGAITLAASVPIPPAYGIHDTYVRDGLAFVFAWNTGVIIYDVGNGIEGGSPSKPREVSRLLTADNGVPGRIGGAQRLVVSQSGERRAALPLSRAGGRGRGRLAVERGHPRGGRVESGAPPGEVAFFHLDGAGTHNFWMDEERQILYAAYYNGGVVALDVSGNALGRPRRPADRADPPGRRGQHLHLGRPARRRIALRDRHAQRLSGSWPSPLRRQLVLAAPAAVATGPTRGGPPVVRPVHVRIPAIRIDDDAVHLRGSRHQGGVPVTQAPDLHRQPDPLGAAVVHQSAPARPASASGPAFRRYTRETTPAESDSATESTAWSSRSVV